MVVAATMMLVVLSVAPTVSDWQRGRLAKQLAAKVAGADDAHVKVPLRQLADLGLPAIAPLVVAATSERAAVASVARQILDEKMAAWTMAASSSTRRYDQREFGAATTQLAAAIAPRIGELGPVGKQWAERLALAMISSADRLSASQAKGLLVNCSQILAAIPPSGPRLRTVSSLPVAETAYAPAPLPAPQPSIDSLTRASDITLEQKPRRQTNTSLAFQGGLTRVTQPIAAVPKPSSELNWAKQRGGDRSEPLETSPLEIVKNVSEHVTNTTKTGKITNVPTPQEMHDRAQALGTLSSDELLKRLRTVDFYEAGVIRRILNRRGFVDEELALIQRLSATDVAERLRLVDDVSILPATAARRLLRELVDDQEATVRLRALTALAAAQAPDLNAIARELAIRDQDPQVSKLALKLMHSTR